MSSALFSLKKLSGKCLINNMSSVSVSCMCCEVEGGGRGRITSMSHLGIKEECMYERIVYGQGRKELCQRLFLAEWNILPASMSCRSNEEAVKRDH